MKKTYIIPSAMVIPLKTKNMFAQSYLDKSEDDGYEMLIRRRLWEEEDEEEGCGLWK